MYTTLYRQFHFLSSVSSNNQLFTFISEGDRKAYYESASFNITQNREYIQKLRKENKELRKKLSDCKAVSMQQIAATFQTPITIFSSSILLEVTTLNITIKSALFEKYFKKAHPFMPVALKKAFTLLYDKGPGDSHLVK